MGTLSCFSAIFTTGGNFCDFLFASPEEGGPSNSGLLLKKRICCMLSKLFSFRVDSDSKGRQNENGRVASPESELIHLK